MSRIMVHLSLVAFVFVAASLPTQGAAPSYFLTQDPETGNPVSVWETQPQGSSTSEILYSYLNGSSWTPSLTLSTIARPGIAPVLAYGGSGSRAVVFATAETTDRVLIRVLDGTTGTWSAASVVSDPAEPSTRPWVAVAGSDIWVSYEVAPPGAPHAVKVCKIDPEPHFERSIIATTTSTQALKTRIYSEAGHLWLDWIDSTTAVGYSEYVDGTWTTPQYQAYDAGEGPDIARDAVRSAVLGQ